MPAMRPPVYLLASHLAALVLVAVVTAVPRPAWAFGPSGHRVAGHIAERHLCAETRERLKPLLNGLTLAEAGLWPDRIRDQPEWRHTKPWHFINVGTGESVARAAQRDADNVLAALARFERELRDARLPIRERGLALRFVVHFVVDIHQPLHVGLREDRGGNTIDVRLGRRSSNLHAVWDAEVLRRPDDPPPVDRARQLKDPPPQVLSRWQRATPLDWARESQALRGQVYDFPRPEQGPVLLDAAYLDRARRLVDQRLLQAGIRLARHLDEALGGCPGGRAK